MAARQMQKPTPTAIKRFPMDSRICFRWFALPSAVLWVSAARHSNIFALNPHRSMRPAKLR
jgi:hypothetical protein